MDAVSPAPGFVKFEGDTLVPLVGSNSSCCLPYVAERSEIQAYKNEFPSSVLEDPRDVLAKSLASPMYMSRPFLLLGRKYCKYDTSHGH